MQPRVLIIIVNYNGSEYLGDCFSSLEKITYSADRIQTVVVDNASVDGSADQIAERWPAVRLIRSQQNLGFAGGNNIGMRLALEEKFDYVYLLNQDTVVTPHFLDEVITVAEADKKIGAVQSKLLLHDRPTIINSIGNDIHFLGFAYAGGNGTPDHPLPVGEITYPSGAGVLIRVAALREVGLFDEELFMYHEDVDLGWKLWLYGWRCVLAPQSVVYHKYEFSRSLKKFYFMERNRLLVLFRNMSLRTLCLILPALVAMQLGMILYAFIGGWSRHELRALGYVLNPTRWWRWWLQRADLQKERRVSDKVIWNRFVGTIAYQDGATSLVVQAANPVFAAYWKLVRRWVK
jgi:GT2 family glycosyltransferase